MSDSKLSSLGDYVLLEVVRPRGPGAHVLRRGPPSRSVPHVDHHLKQIGERFHKVGGSEHPKFVDPLAHLNDGSIERRQVDRDGGTPRSGTQRVDDRRGVSYDLTRTP